MHLAYGHHFGRFSTSVRWRSKVFPHLSSEMGKYTNEFYAGLSHADILNPSITVFRDVQKGDGGYYYLNYAQARPAESA